MENKPPQIARMRKEAQAIFQAGLSAVEPIAATKRFVKRNGGCLQVAGRCYDLSQYHHIYVVGTGKAGAPMAGAIEEILDRRISSGIVTVKYGHIGPLNHIRLIEAGHPLPDRNGEKGSQEIFDLLSRAGPADLVICLLSGGGSALLPLPMPPLTLKDKQETTDCLLACGARIHDINAIRKHMSQVKGGRLAEAAYPAAVICLILSDVVGDDLNVIASGPSVPDPTTFQDCMDIISRYRIAGKLPNAVLNHFESGHSGLIPETPKPGTPAFSAVETQIIGSNTQALQASEAAAKAMGYKTMILSSSIEGETRDVAGVHAAVAKEILRTANPLPPPACVLSGGETTVTIEGKGKGGRNQEFALAGAIGIADIGDTVLLCGGTDGTDGPTDAAGAIADSQTVYRALQQGMEPTSYLAENDAYHFFSQLGDLLITGPTHTNVMDLRIVLVCQGEQICP